MQRFDFASTQASERGHEGAAHRHCEEDLERDTGRHGA